MNIPGITWRGEKIDDVEILRELPLGLGDALHDVNGFILHEGALHVRGASLAPEWHSVRAVYRGPRAFATFYDHIRDTDIPFAQDQFGDQFLIRDGEVLRLFAETGEVARFTESVEDFFNGLSGDIEAFLNIGVRHTMQPGQLLLAYPPFCFHESGAGASLRAVPAGEVIEFHADLARTIRDLPAGGKVRIKVTE